MIRIDVERFLLDDDAAIERQIVGALPSGQVALCHQAIDRLDPFYRQNELF
ncbi:MAG: hypothetical protein ACREDD_06780 [Methylocella sp.]